VAQELRSVGWRVARDIIRRGLPESLEYARRAGVSRCIVVEQDGSRKGGFQVLDPSGKELLNIKVNELKAWIEGLERLR
jgi:histidyl-tRNA synthetase